MPPRHPKIGTITTTWHQQGLEKGREEGLEQGLKRQREMFLMMLDAEFGPLPESVQQRIGAFSTDQLIELARRIMRAESLAELGLEDE